MRAIRLVQSDDLPMFAGHAIPVAVKQAEAAVVADMEQGCLLEPEGVDAGIATPEPRDTSDLPIFLQ